MKTSLGRVLVLVIDFAIMYVEMSASPVGQSPHKKTLFTFLLRVSAKALYLIITIRLHIETILIAFLKKIDVLPASMLS